jgi:hypothetical protein
MRCNPTEHSGYNISPISTLSESAYAQSRVLYDCKIYDHFPREHWLLNGVGVELQIPSKTEGL